MADTDTQVVSPSLNDDLTEAYNQMTAEEPTVDTPEVTEPVAEDTSVEESSESRLRDEQGRFANKPEEEATVAPLEGTVPLAMRNSKQAPMSSYPLLNIGQPQTRHHSKVSHARHRNLSYVAWVSKMQPLRKRLWTCRTNESSTNPCSQFYSHSHRARLNTA